jgi:Na+-driven multidrug efflux pump
MRIVALYGSAPIAAYMIALRLIEFALLPAWGLGNAGATLVGQNLGASQPGRAERSVWQAARYNAIFVTVPGICLIAIARQIVGWFSLGCWFSGMAAGNSSKCDFIIKEHP